jgi:hypothetical protein
MFVFFVVKAKNYQKPGTTLTHTQTGPARRRNFRSGSLTRDSFRPPAHAGGSDLGSGGRGKFSTGLKKYIFKTS